MAKVQPLVSILMPAFNAGETIQRALSSLVAQTIDDWEAIVVDDGSTDGTWERSLSVFDSRIRRLRLQENVGRGAARQIALSHSFGSFICMLDADDWYYPWKLEHQLEALNEHPDAALVSSAVASVGKDGGLVGIRRDSKGKGDDSLAPPLISLFDLRFPRATCMIRSGPARAFRFSNRLLRAEEYHYLARLLKGKRYLVSGRILYSYAEEISFSREGPVPRYLWSAWASLKLLRDFPKSAPSLAVRKTLQGVFAFFSGSSRNGVRKKPMPPTPEEASEYERARCQVDEAMAQVGGVNEQIPG